MKVKSKLKQTAPTKRHSSAAAAKKAVKKTAKATGKVQPIRPAKPIVHAPEVQLENFKRIPLTKLRESDTNPRQSFDPVRLQELADSIKQEGVQIPLKVQRWYPIGPGDKRGEPFYVIIAGARRFRAAKMAGVVDVPCEIYEGLEADRIIELQLIENSDREDVHPMEEAIAMKGLLKLGKYDMDGLAERLGKPKAEIYKKLKYCDLIEPVQKAFLENRITPRHAVLIARLPQAHQMKAYDRAFEQKWQQNGYVPDYDRLKPAKQLEACIAGEFNLDLRKAPFDMKCEDLLKCGGCTDCAKRTGSNPVLFSDIEVADTCVDPTCYNAKVEAHITRQLAKHAGTAAELVRITDDWNMSKVKEGAPLPRSQYTVVNTGTKDQKCKHFRKAIYVAGAKKGFMEQICTSSGCEVHSRSHSVPKTEEQRKAEQAARDDVKKKSLFRTMILESAVAALPAQKQFRHEDLIAVAKDFYEHTWNDVQQRVRKIIGVEKDDYTDSKVKAYIDTLKTGSDVVGFLLTITLCRSLNEPWGDRKPDFLIEVAKRMGVKVEEIKAELDRVFAEKAAKREANRKKKIEAEARKLAKAKEAAA